MLEKKCSARWQIISSLCLMLVGGSTSAGPVDDAYKYYDKGDYKKAVKLFKPLAIKGDRSAEYMLGYMHLIGRGVPQNYGLAAKWFLLAANQNSVESQAYLGSMYSFGEGVKKSDQEALKWFRRAAAGGHEKSKEHLKSPSMLSALESLELQNSRNWTEVENNEVMVVYVDFSTIRKKGDSSSMNILFDYKIAQGEKSEVLSLVFAREYDCKNMRSKHLELNSFSENMGKGQLIYWGNKKIDEEWIPVTHRTVMYTLWGVACGSE